MASEGPVAFASSLAHDDLRGGAIDAELPQGAHALGKVTPLLLGELGTAEPDGEVRLG